MVVVSLTAAELSTIIAVSDSTVPIVVSVTVEVSVEVVSVEVSPQATNVPRIATKRSFFIVFVLWFPFNAAFQKKVTPNKTKLFLKKTAVRLRQTAVYNVNQWI